MDIKWIFFDLDDTLFNFSKASLISLRKLWEEEAEIRNMYDSAESFIDEYHIHNSRMWELHESGKITSEFLKAERFRLTIAPDRNDEEIILTSRTFNDRYLHLLGECNEACEGAEEILKRLSKRYLIGVLTNGFTEVQYRKLRSTGLDRYIQRVVISDEIGVQKPDARLFRYAERETGATMETALMIGDNPKNDIQGALDAGWKAIYYDCKGKPFESDSENYLGRITRLYDVVTLM
ncbi:MAG: YjjG family noncanonical pyrimidine nucleotidase [Muribaculum sp.]|nr:YjjG family noncanonical pyrimidine nucleotidase [Muribaculum sp.]